MIGLRSAGRRNTPSPPRTRPTRTSKSSARDRSPRAAKLQSVGRGITPFRETPRRRPREVRGPPQRGPIHTLLPRAGGSRPLSGTDSGLEAFSRYPADGSFAALPGRTTAKTNYPNPRFLSY